MSESDEDASSEKVRRPSLFGSAMSIEPLKNSPEISFVCALTGAWWLPSHWTVIFPSLLRSTPSLIFSARNSSCPLMFDWSTEPDGQSTLEKLTATESDSSGAVGSPGGCVTK